MKLNLKLFFSLVFFFSCTNNEYNHKLPAKKHGNDLDVLNKKMLLGVWKNSLDVNSTFTLNENVVVYTEYPDAKYSYSLIGDLFMIDLEGVIDTSVILRLDSTNFHLMNLVSGDTSIFVKIH